MDDASQKKKLKLCKFCIEDIDYYATRCPHCSQKVVVKRPFLVFILNFIIPGSGYILKEKYPKAILAFVFTSLGYSFFIVPGLMLHFLILLDSLVKE